MKPNDEMYAQTLVCGATINNTGCSLEPFLNQRSLLRAVPEHLIKGVETTVRKRTGERHLAPGGKILRVAIKVDRV